MRNAHWLPTKELRGLEIELSSARKLYSYVHGIAMGTWLAMDMRYIADKKVKRPIKIGTYQLKYANPNKYQAMYGTIKRTLKQKNRKAKIQLKFHKK